MNIKQKYSNIIITINLKRMKKFSEFTEFAIETARKSGELVMDYFKKDKLEYERKGYNDIATVADFESEKLIMKAIKENYPDHEILAEESGGHENGSNYRWLIDPIDGTTNFKHRLPVFCISIALEAKGDIYTGVVYNPYINEMFVAEIGKGAYLNGNQIKVSDTDTKEFSLYTTGFMPDSEIMQKNLKVFRHFMDTGHLVRRFGSAAVDLCYTAAGRFDGFWEFGLKPWDIAAGILIVKEAGGKVTDIHNKEIRVDSKSIVASNGKMHDEMLALINETVKT